MNLNLAGAKVAIAGSSKGLGFAIAKTFAEENADIWLTGREEKSLKEAANSIGAQYTVCDLETAQGRSSFANSLANTWQGLDILVLNIGSGVASHRGLDCPDEEWLRVMNLNFFSHASLLRLFKPLLAKSKIASVVSISSITGEMRLRAPICYGTAKAALNHFCNAASTELSELGIRYNIVSPGNIFTPGGRWETLQAQDPTGVEQYIQTQVPMKRFATPEEIANFVVFTSSPKASFSTGTVLRVDGGQTPHP